MSDVERVEIEIYGTDTDGSHVGRLETYTVGRTREDELQEEVNSLLDRVADLEQPRSGGPGALDRIRVGDGEPDVCHRDVKRIHAQHPFENRNVRWGDLGVRAARSG